MRIVAIASILFAPWSFAGQQTQPVCVAGKTDFICPAETAKWDSIAVTASASGAGNCSQKCTFVWNITLVSSGTPCGTFDVFGQPGVSTVNVPCGTPSTTTIAGTKKVPCDAHSQYVVSIDYPAGSCPTSDPDGPGPCTIAGVTFTCECDAQ